MIFCRTQFVIHDQLLILRFPFYGIWLQLQVVILFRLKIYVLYFDSDAFVFGRLHKSSQYFAAGAELISALYISCTLKTNARGNWNLDGCFCGIFLQRRWPIKC